MITVNAQIYIGNMSTSKQGAIIGLAADELRTLTGFEVRGITRDDCLATWAIEVDDSTPSYAGEAFVREDFIEAILDVVAETA